MEGHLRDKRVWPLVGGAMLAGQLSAPPVQAQEPGGETGPEEHRNEIAAIVAGTRDLGEDKTFLTLGVEYERRIGSRFGVVAEVEYLFDADRWIVAERLPSGRREA
jgi:hypothetical protein